MLEFVLEHQPATLLVAIGTLALTAWLYVIVPTAQETLAKSGRRGRPPADRVRAVSQGGRELSRALHPLSYDDNPERLAFTAAEACFRESREARPRADRWVEIPFEGKSLPGIFSKANRKGPAPTVFFCNGMDVADGAFPRPAEQSVHRAPGMNVWPSTARDRILALHRKIWITADNWQRAGETALEYLANGRSRRRQDRRGRLVDGELWMMASRRRIAT